MALRRHCDGCEALGFEAGHCPHRREDGTFWCCWCGDGLETDDEPPKHGPYADTGPWDDGPLKDV